MERNTTIKFGNYSTIIFLAIITGILSLIWYFIWDFCKFDRNDFEETAYYTFIIHILLTIASFIITKIIQYNYNNSINFRKNEGLYKGVQHELCMKFNKTQVIGHYLCLDEINNLWCIPNTSPVCEIFTISQIQEINSNCKVTNEYDSHIGTMSPKGRFYFGKTIHNVDKLYTIIITLKYINRKIKIDIENDYESAIEVYNSLYSLLDKVNKEKTTL